MPRELVKYLISTFQLKNVNWAMQTKLAKTLLTLYKFSDLTYAINYYKTKGVNIYSLGWFLNEKNMNEAMSSRIADINSQDSEQSGDRNRQRIEQLNKLQQAERGEDYPSFLFAESEESD